MCAWNWVKSAPIPSSDLRLHADLVQKLAYACITSGISGYEDDVYEPSRNSSAVARLADELLALATSRFEGFSTFPS